MNECPLLAQSGHKLLRRKCPLLGLKRTRLEALGCSELLRRRRKSLACARPRLLRLDGAIARGRRRVQRVEQRAGRLRNLGHGSFKGLGVRLRRLVEAGELANELKRRSVNFLLGRRRLEVEQRLDVTAHAIGSFPTNIGFVASSGMTASANICRTSRSCAARQAWPRRRRSAASYRCGSHDWPPDKHIPHA